MKIIVNLFVGAYLTLSLSISNHVYAGTPTDDSSVLDFLSAIMSGAGKTEVVFKPPVLYKCKTPKVVLTCGIEDSSTVENYYVVYIGENEKFDSAKFLGIKTGLGIPISTCGPTATGTNLDEISFSKLPKHIQDTINIPLNKKALYFRIDLKNGDKKDINVTLEITCVK